MAIGLVAFYFGGQSVLVTIFIRVKLTFKFNPGNICP